MEKIISRKDAFELHEEELIELNMALDIHIDNINKQSK